MPMAPTVALEMTGLPGTVIKRWQGASSSAMAAISLDCTSIGWWCQRPSVASTPMMCTMRGEKLAPAAEVIE